jgi:hypothetical protein
VGDGLTPAVTAATDNDTPGDILVAGDLGVRLISFEAVVPGDPTKGFVPDYLKEVPDTAALVSWRIVTATGQVFFAQDGAQLVRPSAARLDVSAVGAGGSTTNASTETGKQSDYTFKLRLNKNEAAPTILGISIPAGYVIAGQGLAGPTTSGGVDGTLVGTLTGTFSTDNPWEPGKSVAFTGDLRATGSPNEWTLSVNYSDTVNTAASAVGKRADRTHKVSIATPSAEAAGAIKIELNTTGDKAHNQATETWTLTIYGVAGDGNTITNPSVKGVYRWLGTQHTSIDVKDLFSSMAGNQAVVIKES